MRYSYIFFALTGVFMLFGCVATQDDVRGLYIRQNRLEAKTEKLSQEIEAIKRQSLASNSGQMMDQLVALEKKVNTVESANSALKKRVDELTSAQTSSLQFENMITEGTTGSSPAGAPLFTAAYKDLSDGNYKKAREQFNLFLDQNPTSPEASDALYWIAESYYREGKFEQAILDFQRFIDTYPKDSRVPLSYLKQGLALVNIGRKDEAKLFLQTLIDKYPKSDEAKIAKQKLDELAV
jgi:tol-pal system protein YbgF